jgi:(p)ppGpp synthase/HD superfamily hydrolase
MKFWEQELYLKAWNFASFHHKDQKVPGKDFPYINHVGSVTMEIMSAIVRSDSVNDPDLAVQCALLHDVIEDTEIKYEKIEDEFGSNVADGVMALSKNEGIKTKSEQMRDSLERIKKQPKEIWMVKLADRITNLQPPPYYWTKNDIKQYRDEAIEIHGALKDANNVLSSRLLDKIEQYEKYFE